MSGARERSGLGRPRLHLRRTDSTNERARELAAAGAPHGTLVTASEQTAGRGRQGRRWSAPAGSALLMSLVLRWPPSPRPPELLPLAAAVAVCDVAAEGACIKWPNDIVLCDERGLAKLAGILIEGRPQERWAVLGIGLNVAVDLEQLPAEVRGVPAEMGGATGEVDAAPGEVDGARAEVDGTPAEMAIGGSDHGAGPARGGRDEAGGDGEAAEAPSEAVHDEALASTPPAADDGTELEPGADEELQRNVQEALDHAAE